jgi:hypothetical protein
MAAATVAQRLPSPPSASLPASPAAGAALPPRGARVVVAEGARSVVGFLRDVNEVRRHIIDASPTPAASSPSTRAADAPATQRVTLRTRPDVWLKLRKARLSAKLSPHWTG